MKSKILLTICLNLALALPLVAGDLEVSLIPEAIPPPSDAGPGLSLDLAAAYQMALARNLDLQVGRYDVAASNEGIRGFSGIFDPNFTASIDGSAYETPATTQLDGAAVQQGRSTRFELGLSQFLPTGTTVSLNTNFDRSESNSLYSNINPSWRGSLSLILSQPLLEGFGTKVTRANIVIARNNRDSTATAFAVKVNSTLVQVENAYWELVKARETVSVREQSLELAERLLGETKERVDVGTSAPIDMVQSEAGVATRLQELIYARNAAANAEDNLKAALGFDQPAEWMTDIETTEGYEVAPDSADLRKSIETALQERPEIAQQRLALANLELNVVLARNAILPSLTLDARYTYGGVGGDILIRDEGQVIDKIPGGWDDAGQQIIDRDFPNWRLALNLAMPIGNNDAKAKLAQRRFELRKGQVELEALKQQIILEVRRAVRGLDDGAAAVEAAGSSRKLAERNLEAEQTKFANGLSTNYKVLEIQEDLSQALLGELTSRIDYRKAQLGYRNVTGTMLEAEGINIVDPGAPAAPHDYWKDIKWMQFVDIRELFSSDDRGDEVALEAP